MKRLEVTYASDDYDGLEAVLVDSKLVFLFQTVTIGDKTGRIYSALVPDELVDKVIDEVSKTIDLRHREAMISSTPVEGVVSSYLDKLKEKVAQKPPTSNPIERLIEHTERYTRVNYKVVLITVFTSIIALFALFSNNTITLIGAMLLSPLLGPINAFSVNGSLGRLRKMGKSQLSLGLLIITVMLVSFVGTTLIDLSRIYPLGITALITNSGSTNITDLIIAVVLGLAGGLSLFIALPEMLIGVAVAVALVPPAAVCGVGISFGDPHLFISALAKTLVNIIGLELGGVLMLRLNKVLPRMYYEKAKIGYRTWYSILTLLILIVLVGVVILFVQ